MDKMFPYHELKKPIPDSDEEEDSRPSSLIEKVFKHILKQHKEQKKLKMPDGSANTSAVKKELRTPTPFSGKIDDLRRFLQEVKIYLLAC